MFQDRIVLGTVQTQGLYKQGKNKHEQMRYNLRTS